MKPWGADECVLWHHPTPTDPLDPTQGPRPLAWIGELDPRGCPVADPPLWLGYYDKARSLGVFERLDGATGQALDTVEVPWPERTWGPYGGAVNRAGDLFVIGWGDAPAIRIDHDTLAVTVFHHEGGPFHYGMALDARGDLWVAGCDRNIYHLDPATRLWSIIGAGPGCLRGLMVDERGRAFIAHNGAPPGLVVVDTDARAILQPNLILPGAEVPVGVSIDVEGYVWVVDQGGWAYKLDPDTYQIVGEVRGLESPYTYSDMTGAGLNLVVRPPR